MERRVSRRKIVLFTGDALFIGATLAGAVLIQAARHRQSPIAVDPTGWGLVPHILLWLCYLAAFYIFDLYQVRLKVFGIRFAVNLAAALAVVVASGGLLYSAFPRSMNRALLVRHLLLTVLFTVSWRALFVRAFKTSSERKTALLVGAHESSEVLRPLLDDMKGNLVIAKRAEDVLERTGSGPAPGLIIFSPDALDDAGLARSLVGTLLKGVPVVDLASCLETMTGKIPLSLIGDRWLLQNADLDPRGKILYTHFRQLGSHSKIPLSHNQ